MRRVERVGIIKFLLRAVILESMPEMRLQQWRKRSKKRFPSPWRPFYGIAASLRAVCEARGKKTEMP